MIQFLGWDYDEHRVRRAIEATSFPSLQQAEQASGFAERSTVARSGRFFRHGESGRWRKVLTARQAAQVIVHHREAMELLGYEIPGRPLAVLRKPAATSNGDVAQGPAPSAVTRTEQKAKRNKTKLLASSAPESSVTPSDAGTPEVLLLGTGSEVSICFQLGNMQLGNMSRPG